jgi:hypothetical protein
MATVLSNKAQPGVSPKFLPSGVIAVCASYTFGSAPSLNDLVQMMKIPAGATVIDMILDSDDLDSNGTPTMKFDVGDATTAARFIAASTVPQAGGVVHTGVAAGTAYQYSADTWINVKVNTAAATFQTGTVRLTALYTMDP